ncbi:MAG TPA: THUMP domain-containing protein, partial [Bacteroidota bacterium]|nr:THUMP domain-containing protein [Bacteroidota bacterium]
MSNEEVKFEMTAKTVFALEEVLADELAAIGAEKIKVLNRAVSFTGTKETMYRANLELRTALRILKPVVTFRVRNETELYTETRRFAWDRYLTPKTTFAIDSFVHSAHFNHANYVALKVKDAIVDQLRTVYDGQRPNVELEHPDVRLNVHISEELCTISLDSSGNSLHKRGYRVGQGLAPINEVLAAGMILLTGWRGESDFVDPMCG